jgi:hypothetical protein
MMLTIKPIETKNKIISISGKVIYNDSRKRIDIKKPIKDLFEDINGNVLYTMEMCLSKEIAVQRVKDLSGNNIVPIILYFSIGDKK